MEKTARDIGLLKAKRAMYPVRYQLWEAGVHEGERPSRRDIGAWRSRKQAV